MSFRECICKNPIPTPTTTPPEMLPNPASREEGQQQPWVRGSFHQICSGSCHGIVQRSQKTMSVSTKTQEQGFSIRTISASSSINITSCRISCGVHPSKTCINYMLPSYFLQNKQKSPCLSWKIKNRHSVASSSKNFSERPCEKGPR